MSKTLSDFTPKVIELAPYDMKLFRNFTCGRRVDGRGIKRLCSLRLIEKTASGKYRRTFNAGIPRIG